MLEIVLVLVILWGVEIQQIILFNLCLGKTTHFALHKSQNNYKVAFESIKQNNSPQYLNTFQTIRNGIPCSNFGAHRSNWGFSSNIWGFFIIILQELGPIRSTLENKEAQKTEEIEEKILSMNPTQIKLHLYAITQIIEGSGKFSTI
ncbi:hypothetical protein VP01_117g7 [Puccinia sorghi]|uniref:Uncharacterized protein n=1 Tax=Puccinia sorghi TaxID=27349 RepID=A0A0L6VR49_9BASI|nr:hypothetical protein VP01_117g7 [Puccinia sorghi]